MTQEEKNKLGVALLTLPHDAIMEFAAFVFVCPSRAVCWKKLRMLLRTSGARREEE